MRTFARPSDDTSRLIGDLIRFGTIASVDARARTAVVQTGDVTTPPLRWLSFAGQFATHIPATPGEQVVLLCPEGDIGHAVILRAIESADHPSPASGPLFRIKMPNGTTFDYDPEANRLTLNLTGGMDITAPDGATLTGDFEITGKVSVTGEITATGKIKSDDDVTASGISLKSHMHGNVQTGLAKTGLPE